MSNAFTFASSAEFARKASLDCVLPAIGVALFHKECGFEQNAQLGLASHAIFTALSYLPDTECKVDEEQMIEYMAQAIEQVHKLNRDKKSFHITHSAIEMLTIAYEARWITTSDEGEMNLTDKWVSTTGKK